MGNNSRGQLSVDIHAQVSIAWFYCQMPFVFLKQRKWTPVFRWGSWRTWVLSQSAIVSFSPDLEPILYDKKKEMTLSLFLSEFSVFYLFSAILSVIQWSLHLVSFNVGCGCFWKPKKALSTSSRHALSFHCFIHVIYNFRLSRIKILETSI